MKRFIQQETRTTMIPQMGTMAIPQAPCPTCGGRKPQVAVTRGGRSKGKRK